MDLAGSIVLLLYLVVHLMVLPDVLGFEICGLQCPKAFWVFGDSLTDTGNTQAAFPNFPGAQLNYPYGMSYTFLDKPGRNRYSDGHLVIDFIAQAFGYNFFGTYQHALNRENYIHGANFAYAGAAARFDTTLNPFYLSLEISQFLRLKNISGTYGYLPGLYEPVFDAFTDGAYIIPEMGGDDFLIAAINDQMTPLQIIASILPQTLAAVRDAIVTLHNSGSKLIILFNIPPQGCNSAYLTLLSAFSPKDAQGCLTAYNAIDEDYNSQLNQTVIALQQKYSGDGTRIFLFDYYSAYYEILTHPSEYGFTNTLQACCGYGGQYDYNPYVSCGNSGYVPPNSTNFVNINKACPTPETYILWDGLSFTQAFYRQIAKFFLTGQFMHSPRNLSFNLFQSCSLNFYNFN